MILKKKKHSQISISWSSNNDTFIGSFLFIKTKATSPEPVTSPKPKIAIDLYPMSQRFSWVFILLVPKPTLSSSFPTSISALVSGMHFPTQPPLSIKHLCLIRVLPTHVYLLQTLSPSHRQFLSGSSRHNGGPYLDRFAIPWPWDGISVHPPTSTSSGESYP